MREILFRGKDIETGKWHYGYLKQGKNTCIGMVDRDCKGKPTKEFEFIVDPKTVLQYTGWIDWEGKMIFEGSIISVKNQEGGEIYRFVVKYGNCGGTKNVTHDVGYMGFYFEEITNKIPEEFMLRNDPLYWLNAYKCYVIGNVFDDRELLREN